jgi:hypothetical protein
MDMLLVKIRNLSLACNHEIHQAFPSSNPVFHLINFIFVFLGKELTCHDANMALQANQEGICLM